MNIPPTRKTHPPKNPPTHPPKIRRTAYSVVPYIYRITDLQRMSGSTHAAPVASERAAWPLMSFTAKPGLSQKSEMLGIYGPSPSSESFPLPLKVVCIIASGVDSRLHPHGAKHSGRHSSPRSVRRPPVWNVDLPIHGRTSLVCLTDNPYGACLAAAQRRHETASRSAGA